MSIKSRIAKLTLPSLIASYEYLETVLECARNAIAEDYYNKAVNFTYCLERDYEKAIEYHKLAAEYGHPTAAITVARAYEDGTFRLRKNNEKAIEYYELAAKNGHAHAYFRLARAYRYGKLGLERDYKNAIEHYKKAIDLGHADAASELARAYRHSELGLSIDKKSALEYYRLAFDYGNIYTQRNISELEANTNIRDINHSPLSCG